MNRRHFLGASATAITSAAIRTHAQDSTSQVSLGIMGMGTRGKALAKALALMPGVKIAWLIEPDQGRLGQANDLLAKSIPKGAKPPQTTDHYQRALDDKGVDALVVTAPNHWHAPATLLACAAGKHVYVEKPCCHNPQEGEWIVAAAKKTRPHRADRHAETKLERHPGGYSATERGRNWHSSRSPNLVPRITGRDWQKRAKSGS